MAVYVVAGILIGILGIATAIALILGLLGVTGMVQFIRCESCGHVAEIGRAHV